MRSSPDTPTCTGRIARRTERRPTARAWLARGLRQRQRERGVLVELAAAAQLDLEVGEDAEGALQGRAVGRPGLGDGLLRQPRAAGGGLRRSPSRAGRPRAARRRGAPSAGGRRSSRPGGPVARRGRPGPPPGRASSACRGRRGRRPGRRPAARRRRRPGCSTCSSVSRVSGWIASASFSSSRAIRCWPGPASATSALPASGSSCRPSSRARSPAHFGSSQGLGAGHSRTSPPLFSTALSSCFSGLPRTIRTSTVSGGIAPSAASSGSSSAAFQAPASSTSR